MLPARPPPEEEDADGSGRWWWQDRDTGDRNGGGVDDGDEKVDWFIPIRVNAEGKVLGGGVEEMVDE